MRFKVLLIIFALLTSVAQAADGKYTLTYKDNNKWVAQEDITPLRNSVVFFQNNNLKIKATCSQSEKFCQQRVDIINHIFKKQKVKQTVSVINNSKYVPKNKIILESINLDKNKYSTLILDYKNKEILPIKKSKNDFSNLLKYAENKYLSKFKMYCKTVDQLCKNRFNTLNAQLANTLTFKYNFALYVNENLANNQAQIVAHRHDYAIHKPIKKPVTTAKKEKAKQIKKAKKDSKLVYTKEKNIIVFKEKSADLLLLEKVKIENLIAKSKTNKFAFACGGSDASLCQERVHSIKNYALENTSNIIIMNEFKHKIYRDYVLIVNAE